MKYPNDNYSDYGNSESRNDECSQDSENESFDPDFRMESVNVMDIPHSNEVENDGTENTESDVFQGSDLMSTYVVFSRIMLVIEENVKTCLY